jgi:acetyl esterase
MKYRIFIISILFCAGLKAQDNTNPNKPSEFTYKIIGSDSLKAYVFYPVDKPTNRKHASIAILHGGGWVMGDPSWGFWHAEKYAKLGLVSIAVEYRLSDEKNITPIDAIEDARDFFIWMRENANDLKIKQDRIAAFGWSAGAHLIACSTVFPGYGTDTTITSIPNALILQSPALSIINDEWFKKLLLNRGNPIDFSPAQHIRKNMPPSVIVIGRDDTVTPLIYSEFFRDEMIKNGNVCSLFVYDGVGHLFTPSDQPDNGWPKPDKVVSEKAFDAIDSFLKELGYIK